MSRIGAGLDNMVIQCLGNLIILLLKFHNFHFKSIYLTAFISEVSLEPPVRAIVIKKSSQERPVWVSLTSHLLVLENVH